ncbi:MAG: redoxin domain-containing protein [Alphaproteobacteria bacterium]
MPKIIAYTMAAAILIFSALPVNAAVEIGKPAPEIEAVDTNGNPFKLSDHKGKIVVLEWTNHQCPFVVKHYGSGNMQAVQKTARDQDAEWISIVSSAPERQGHVSAEEANAITADNGAKITAKILDENGEIGKRYNAMTTPHMFVIDAEGNVAYAGAIDSNSSPNPKTIEGATNYVLAAIESLNNGTPVEISQTRPYGCAVKY